MSAAVEEALTTMVCDAQILCRASAWLVTHVDGASAQEVALAAALVDLALNAAADKLEAVEVRLPA